MQLSGKTVLISGGAQGIGAQFAAAFAAEGANVMIGDVQTEVAAKTAAEIGDNVASTSLDVTDDASWAAAVKETIARFGGFDILINNAGIEITSLVINVDADELRKMCNVNVVGPLLGMKHAFRAMGPDGPAGKGGSVINISSVAATIAFPAIAGYSATKSAVDRLTRVGAMEAGKLGLGVRVNCIYPGLIANQMGIQLANDVVANGLAPDMDAAVAGVVESTPLGRLAESSEIADAAIFLASDKARFITGIGLPVDGGMGM